VDGSDRLSGWSARHARVLVEQEGPTARAALVDTNGDGRELWFGLELRGPSGEWLRVVEEDDAGGHRPAERLDGSDVIYSWGSGHARERKTVDYEGFTFPVRVERNGWWLLLATVPGA
jgi:hypothetical protein